MFDSSHVCSESGGWMSATYCMLVQAVAYCMFVKVNVCDLLYFSSESGVVSVNYYIFTQGVLE